MTFDRMHAPLTSTIVPETRSLVEARFIPRQYEPNYAYPLLVLFHARGSDEEQLVRAMPALSWRNYVGLALRGPEPVVKRDRLAGFGWGRQFEHPDRARSRRDAGLSEGRDRSTRPVRRGSRAVRRVRGSRLHGDPPDPSAPARPFRADLLDGVRRRGRGRLLAGPDLSRAVRRNRRHQRVAARRAASPGAAQGVSRPSRSCPCTGPGTTGRRSTKPAATSPRSGQAGSAWPSSPIHAPIA